MIIFGDCRWPNIAIRSAANCLSIQGQQVGPYEVLKGAGHCFQVFPLLKCLTSFYTHRCKEVFPDCEMVKFVYRKKNCVNLVQFQPKIRVRTWQQQPLYIHISTLRSSISGGWQISRQRVLLIYPSSSYIYEVRSKSNCKV